MKYFGAYLSSLVLLLILFTSCQKEIEIGKNLETKILFSVDLNVERFQNNNYPDDKEYIAAYTTNGELIDYACLTDSVKWELRAPCKEDKIDIVYFTVSSSFSNLIHYLEVQHFKNVDIGYSFTDPFRTNQQWNLLDIILKVEDFGNYKEESLYTGPYEMWPHRHFGGEQRYHGGFHWDKIENGYAYDVISKGFLPDELRMSLVIFERSTNQPYIAYIENPVNHYNKGDTIVFNKNEFKPCEFKTIQLINADEDSSMSIVTFNSKENSKDLVTFFEYLFSENSIRYIRSDILPISYWEYNYNTLIKTSYTIRTNKDIPSSIEIKEIKGSKFEVYGNQYFFTHGETFSDKNLVRSTLRLSKYISDRTAIDYKIHFNGIESFGREPVNSIEIPEEILINNTTLRELDNMKWRGLLYDQIYTNLPENSPLKYLENEFLRLNKKDSLTDEYIYEEFRVNL